MAVWQHTRLMLGVAALAIGVGCGTDSVLTPAEPKEPPPTPPVLSMAALSPLALEGMTGRPVTPAPQVKVTDESGGAVAGVRVSFLVSGDDRSSSYIQTPAPLTDAEGIATAGAWWLGWRSGVQELTASISGGARVVFRATALQEDFCALAQACTEADLAFIRHNAVHAVALPDSQPVKLVDIASKPAWSPDGSRLAFGRPGTFQSDVWQLCIANVESQDVRCATGGFQGYIGSKPSWSPDGSTVAFAVFNASLPNGGYFDHRLYLLDAASMVLRTLPAVGLRSVSWSPDGRTLALATASGALGVMNADGSGLKIVAHRLELGRFSVSEVAWSPDGRQLAASLNDQFACPWGCDMAIGVMDADGTELRLLANSHSAEGAFLADPIWSPDGQRIAYTLEHYSSTARSDVLIVSVDGGTPKVLLPDASSPSWRR